MRVDQEITRDGVLTALYLCPVEDWELRAATVPQLAAYVARLYTIAPRSEWDRLGRGLRVLVDQRGPYLDRTRYALAEALTDALTAMELDVAVHPVEFAPDHCHPN
ncbi:hypothetical protein [Saccharopolyspora sp. 6V]|uniref:hypothetical protein n=1 Tax=Saccharopolyspora sp. 6V TaxID=2877239 RepID=UPI001CD4797B|nr:hypothetical protein [Saccharopolyspora sp. 6V]MCA1194434.1 hypothetical protein [Saccharopolyspora sp. 6V]